MTDHIYKHTFEIVVLTDGESMQNYDPDSLETISFDITDGDFIGQFKKKSTELVRPENVEKELFDIGNDGTFFDSWEIDD